MPEEIKFRASYTVLSLWASGNWERAIKQYFKLEKFTTPQMADGLKYHKDWCQYISQNKKLPLEFGGKELANPICEQKKVVSLAPWLDLVYIIDCYDKPVLHEFKTGKQSSESYASSMQLPIYAVGATYSGLLVEKAEIYHYDQYLKKCDMSVVWITDKVMNDAYNYILTLSGEMQNYLLVNGLYQRFGAQLAKANAQNGNVQE